MPNLRKDITEQQVQSLLNQGLSPAMIAEKLHVSTPLVYRRINGCKLTVSKELDDYAAVLLAVRAHCESEGLAFRITVANVLRKWLENQSKPGAGPVQVDL